MRHLAILLAPAMLVAVGCGGPHWGARACGNLTCTGSQVCITCPSGLPDAGGATFACQDAPSSGAFCSGGCSGGVCANDLCTAPIIGCCAVRTVDCGGGTVQCNNC